jgi:DNA-binding IscR family transcriptional regulator
VDLALSRRGDYVLRAAVDLAVAWSDDGAYRKIREVAESMDLPRSYTPHVLGALARAGLAEARAGRAGGYRLRRAPRNST